MAARRRPCVPEAVLLSLLFAAHAAAIAPARSATIDAADVEFEEPLVLAELSLVPPVSRRHWPKRARTIVRFSYSAMVGARRRHRILRAIW